MHIPKDKIIKKYLTKLSDSQDNPSEKSGLSRTQSKANGKETSKIQNLNLDDDNPFSDLRISNNDYLLNRSDSNKNASTSRRKPLVLDDDSEDFLTPYKMQNGNPIKKRNLGIMDDETSPTDLLANSFNFDDFSSSQNHLSEKPGTRHMAGSWSVDKNGGNDSKVEEEVVPKNAQPFLNGLTKENANTQKSATNNQECAICLDNIDEVVAKLDGCPHVFCFKCIQDWSKVTNLCPLCKERFKKIGKFTKDGVKLADCRVKTKNQVNEEPEYEILEGKLDNLNAVYLNFLDVDDCYECHTEGDMQKLLVCDECNFLCCHTYCCNPPLRRVPVDPWFCKMCRPDLHRDTQKEKERKTYQKKTTKKDLDRSMDSSVTKSIRSNLTSGSLLAQLFEQADKEINKKQKGRGVVVSSEVVGLIESIMNGTNDRNKAEKIGKKLKKIKRGKKSKTPTKSGEKKKKRRRSTTKKGVKKTKKSKKVVKKTKK